jgi:hypothetical protein
MMGHEYDRGGYVRGHSVPCKHCGCLLTEHRNIVYVQDPEMVRPGFEVSPARCMQYDGGYEPKDLGQWVKQEEFFLQAEEEHTGSKGNIAGWVA